MENLPFSQSCENNKDSILEVLRQAFRERRQVLEIASGTGQHACYFASQMAWLRCIESFVQPRRLASANNSR